LRGNGGKAVQNLKHKLWENTERGIVEQGPYRKKSVKITGEKERRGVVHHHKPRRGAIRFPQTGSEPLWARRTKEKKAAG